MIRNGDFMEGWRDMPPAPGFLINQEPSGWKLKWLDPGESLYDDPGSQAFGVPECVHKLSRQLPPHEQLGQPAALILAGDITYKIFHANAPFGATLSQTVSGLEPGSSATLTVPIQLHLHGEQDPFGAESGVWVNGDGGWAHGHLMGDRRWHHHVVQFTVPPTGQAEVVIRVKSKWPRPKDFFIDHVTLAATAGVPGDGGPPEDGLQEISRQTLSLIDALAGDTLRLDLSTRQGDRWLLQRSVTEQVQGESRLEIVVQREEDGAFAFDPGAKGLALEAATPVSGQRVLGMDVSIWQEQTVNFEKAADLGVRYCFIRAGSGQNEKDPNFEHQFREAGRAGMLRGIYYYLYPESAATVGDRTPVGQARRFVSLLKEGYLFGRYLEMRENQLAVTTANLNLREQADGNSRLLAEIPAGSTVRLLNTTQINGYYLCETSVDVQLQPRRLRELPQPNKLDLLAYVKGNGQQYEVRNASGGQERFRTEEAGLTFYQVKNAQWEQFFYDNDFVYRDIDTSPGRGRYYRLTDPDRQNGSRWLRRHMAVGETYNQARQVQFYNKADGSPSAANSGHVTDTIKVVAHHPQYTFQTGMAIEDVLEIHWVNNAQDHTPKEKYFYAKGLGMVGWQRGHPDPNSPAWSAVSEIHDPGAREPIPRERVTVR